VNEVRYFGKLVDPALYGRGYGLLGVAIRVADWLRVRLERFIVANILRLELRKAGHPETLVRKLASVAMDDPDFRPAAHNKAVVDAVRPLLRDRLFPEHQDRAGIAESRYAEGRVNSTRPVPVEQGLFGIAARNSGMRSTRYASKNFTIANPDGDFEEVDR